MRKMMELQMRMERMMQTRNRKVLLKETMR